MVVRKKFVRNFRKKNQQDPVKQKRSKKLDMRKTDEFNFLLGKIVDPLPESVKGAIKGSVYSIASKQGTKEVKDYISKKHSEGIIDNDTEKKLMDLVADYTKYR